MMIWSFLFLLFTGAIKHYRILLVRRYRGPGTKMTPMISCSRHDAHQGAKRKSCKTPRDYGVVSTVPRLFPELPKLSPLICQPLIHESLQAE